MERLCLPIIKAKRPVWDTFPGAWYTIGIDAVMPNGRTLQVASCHHYRDQWAKAFDITYENRDAKQQHGHQVILPKLKLIYIGMFYLLDMSLMNIYR